MINGEWWMAVASLRLGAATTIVRPTIDDLRLIHPRDSFSTALTRRATRESVSDEVMGGERSENCDVCRLTRHASPLFAGRAGRALNSRRYPNMESQTAAAGLMGEKETRTLVIRRVHEEARDIRAFDVLPEGARDSHELVFTPGQVALLEVAGAGRAYFAIASAPEDDELEFLVKRSNEAAGRSLYELGPGDRVELVEIAGHGFDLTAQEGRDLVFVAMGTGVAPLRSALRSVLRRAERFGQIVVLYGARTPEDFCYRDETDIWKAAGVELRQVISRPDGYEWAGSTGYVQSLLDHVLPTLSDPVALVCGSREMIEQTRDRLHEMGFAPERILTNY
jgi:sulfhydrogenase subunit gamma (sulfur reductase)